MERLKVRLDLWQLEIFCTVAEQRSFSRAAEMLFLAQPTVTSHIASLEKRLGVKLFDRTTRRVTLTPAGKLLYRHAKTLLREHEEALQELAQFVGGLAGTLTFGASTIPGQYILPKLLAQFRRQFPSVALAMHLGASGQILDGVLSGEWELGIIGTRPREPLLHIVPLWHDEIVLIVPPDHHWAQQREVPVSELVRQPLVIRERGSGTRSALEQFLAQHGISLSQANIAAELGSTEAVKQFVAAGGGIGAVSIRAVECEQDLQKLAVVRLKEGRILRRFYGIAWRNRTLSPVARTFWNFVMESVKADEAKVEST
jgi:DNA-binding transcriptional LysR family regulator